MGHPNTMGSPGHLFVDNCLLVQSALGPILTHTTLETKPPVSQHANAMAQYYQK